MALHADASTDATLADLGGRLARIRLDRNLTQKDVADQAGVAKRTVERLESGAAATHLSGFIQVCRVLGLLDRLDLLVPDALPSPLAQVKLRGRQRRRASSAKPPARLSKTWTWGDES